MKRWLTFVAFLLCIVSSMFAMGIGLNNGQASIMAAAYAGGIAGFFAYIFITLPTINKVIKEGAPLLRMMLPPVGVELLVMLAVPFALLGMTTLSFTSALDAALLVDTAALVLPFALLSSLRAGVAQNVPAHVIMLGICAAVLPFLYLLLLAWERHGQNATTA